MKKFISSFFFVTFLFVIHSAQCARQGTDGSSITSLQELKEGIEKILEDTHTSGIGLALVNKDSIVWCGGLGMADKEEEIPADENTLFRIGSVSKMFVALAVLKLQEEGKLSLDDKVRDLIPEIEFENEWEETDPVRVAHLLEHTTGWDDYHLTEYAHSDPNPVTLREGLDYHPHSRESRWIPGTRMAYCNSGPPVAAYIVEKITGQLFEEYVQENFFTPLGMVTSTFMFSDDYEKLGATLYIGDKPQDYWHILQRPAGSINSSALEMATFARLFLNRGTLDSIEYVSAESIDRMEVAETNVGIAAGLDVGYGLANYTNPHKGYTFRGHNGGVNGGLTELAYLPEYGVGHFFSINSGNGHALNELSKLIKDYEIAQIEKDSLANESTYKGEIDIEDGYYVANNPRTGIATFIFRLLNIVRFSWDGERLVRSDMFGGNKKKFYAKSATQFVEEDYDKVVLVSTTDPLAGRVVQHGTEVFQPISSVLVFGRLGMGALWAVLIIPGLLMWVLVFFRHWAGKGSGESLKIRKWPSLTSLMIILCTILVIQGIEDPFSFGKVGLVSIAIMVSSILFGVGAVWSLVKVILHRNLDIGKWTYWHMTILSGLHVVVALYLLRFGIIGVMTWG